jgi:addiction module RelE/StbE family toxin
MAKNHTEQFEVTVTQNAEKDLNEIILFISQENLQTALKILEKLQNRIKTLDHFPHRGAYVPELFSKNIKDYRQLLESPWRIIYRVEKRTVYILAVVDSRRNLQDVLVGKLITPLYRETD